MNQKFPKTEKLKSSKTIESLFSDGKTLSKYPIKVFYIPSTSISRHTLELEKNLAAFAVPKKKFKLAVDRNRVKRQLRETYRRNKHIIESTDHNKITMLFLYLGKVKPEYAELNNTMEKLLQKLKESVCQDKI